MIITSTLIYDLFLQNMCSIRWKYVFIQTKSSRFYSPAFSTRAAGRSDRAKFYSRLFKRVCFYHEQARPRRSVKLSVLFLLRRKETRRDEPDILHGRLPLELPSRKIGALQLSILYSMTGPDGGLTTVNKRGKHLSMSDPDIHFIDDQTGTVSYNTFISA